MDDPQLWLRFERRLSRIIGKVDEWPPGYIRFVIRGHGGCFDIFTHLTKAERLLLYTLALRLPPGNCMVELGSYLGASSCFLAAAASETGGRLYCVDTWQNEGMTEGPRDTYQEFLSNTRRYYHLIVPIRARTQDAASNFDQMIDLLFIDADHRYEAVVADLGCWLPKLRPGGWLLMHDWGWAEGVKRAIQEIVVPLQVDTPETLPNLYAVRINSRTGLP